MWWRDRHISHGRLLAAGHKEGINNFDLFDAACFALGELFRLAEATGFTYDAERVQKLRSTIKLGQNRPDDALAQAKAMRAEMERSAGIEPQEAGESEAPGPDSVTSRIDPVAQAKAMRDEMARGDSTGP